MYYSILLGNKRDYLCERKSSMFINQNVSGNKSLIFRNIKHFDDFIVYAFQITMDNRTRNIHN